MNKRDTVKKIKAGSVEIGGGAPVSVQTMCNTKTWDVEATVEQILRLEEPRALGIAAEGGNIRIKHGDTSFVDFVLGCI